VQRAGVFWKITPSSSGLGHNLLRMARTSYRGFGPQRVDLSIADAVEHDHRRITAVTLAQQDIPRCAATPSALNAIIDIGRARRIEPVCSRRSRRCTAPSSIRDRRRLVTRPGARRAQTDVCKVAGLLERYNDAMPAVAAIRGVLLHDAAHEMPRTRVFITTDALPNEGAGPPRRSHC